MKYLFLKIGMTSIFSDDGKQLPVTLLKQCDAKVLRLENPTSDSYDGLVVVEYDKGSKRKVVRGWKLLKSQLSSVSVGQAISFSVEPGMTLKLSGVSKGKGFQDAMTRHGFGGGPASHGSRFHRAPGSVGARTEPGRTPKGKKLPGRMGAENVSLKNVKVCSWNSESKLLAVLGSAPGANGSVVIVGGKK